MYRFRVRERVIYRVGEFPHMRDRNYLLDRDLICRKSAFRSTQFSSDFFPASARQCERVFGISKIFLKGNGTVFAAGSAFFGMRVAKPVLDVSHISLVCMEFLR